VHICTYEKLFFSDFNLVFIAKWLLHMVYNFIELLVAVTNGYNMIIRGTYCTIISLNTPFKKDNVKILKKIEK
jgi:hypothetical protein